MKWIKRILVTIFGLFAFLLILAIFVKKDYVVVRTVVINAPIDSVFNYIKFVKNQDNYGVWFSKDPKMEKSYKGTDGKVGFVYAWKSTNEEVGVGEQEIVKIEEGKRIDMKLRFKVPFEAEDDCYLLTEKVGSAKTKVSWGFSGSMPYPINIMNLFMDMDNMVGSDLQKGLDKLKVVLEEKKEN